VSIGMEKFRLPPEYKDYYHIKQEDLDRLNKHIEYFESQNKRKRYIRRWIFGGVIIVITVMFVFGVIDLSYFRSLFGGKVFLIKDSFKVKGKEIDVRISMPKEGIINVVLDSESFIDDYIVISNSYEARRVRLGNGIGLVSVKYDKKIFIFCGEDSKLINIERLKPME